MGDPHLIRDAAALRAVVGAPLPGLALKNEARISDEAREYIERSPFIVLATCDAEGRLDASPKGDPAGQLVHVIDDTTIAIAERPGNKRADGYKNIIDNPHVGLNFLIPGRGDTLRINGRARLVSDAPFFDEMVVKGHRPILAIVVEIWSGLALSAVGVTAALGSAFALTTYLLIGERERRRRDAVSLTFYGFLFAAVSWAFVEPLWSFPWDVLDDSVSLQGNLSQHTAPVWALVGFVVVIGTMLAISLLTGGLRHTAIAGLFRIQGWDLADIERRVDAAQRIPIRVPLTAIWSRRDGIVAWQACVDLATPGAVNLEARSCHWALGLDPDVLAALAHHLRKW